MPFKKVIFFRKTGLIKVDFCYFDELIKFKESRHLIFFAAECPMTASSLLVAWQSLPLAGSMSSLQGGN